MRRNFLLGKVVCGTKQERRKMAKLLRWRDLLDDRRLIPRVSRCGYTWGWLTDLALVMVSIGNDFGPVIQSNCLQTAWVLPELGDPLGKFSDPWSEDLVLVFERHSDFVKL